MAERRNFVTQNANRLFPATDLENKHNVISKKFMTGSGTVVLIDTQLT